jgi:PIN domain nuclease of toxin-antitoxin system
MRLLLDTQIFLWLNLEPEKCSSGLLDICRKVETELVLSVASIWEIQIKHQLGKLPIDIPLSDIVEASQREYGMQLLNISPRHIYALSALPDHHRDPFDRLLIAQAQIESMPLATVDRIIPRYSITTLC